MDKILRSWGDKQLFTLEAIAAGDPAERPKRADAAEKEDSRKQIADARKVLERVSGRKEG